MNSVKENILAVEDGPVTGPKPHYFRIESPRFHLRTTYEKTRRNKNLSVNRVPKLSVSGIQAADY